MKNEIRVLKEWILALEAIECNVADLFINIRMKLNLSQTDLGRFLDVNRYVISRIENKILIPKKQLLEKLYLVLHDRTTSH